MKKIISIIIAILVLVIGTSAIAHSGRTDSSGGHRDNKNVSGLGSYHYHCGGHPAHLHPNGICPYSSNSSQMASSSSSNNRPTATPTATPFISYNIPTVRNSYGESVSIIKLGTAYSIIKHGNSTTTVRTDGLDFSGVTDPMFGVIYAPKTGKVSLRQTASDSAKTIKQCVAGQIVYVVEKGKDFSCVVYQDTTGYLRNSALKYYNLIEHNVDKAYLCINEKIDGSAVINIRLLPDGLIIGKYPTGTEVVVIEKSDKWCEIEVDGLHGYVMSKFLTFSP